MTAVLGIDAAWTEPQPSGVALVRPEGDQWRCAALAPSYGSFLDLARGVPVEWDAPAQGGKPDPAALVGAAGSILGEAFSGVVAVDMALASVPIERRREADNAISRAFGGRGCGVHSPSAVRPGRLSDDLREEFGRLGFRLAAVGARVRAGRWLVEVYPHIAVMALTGASYRVPYKLARARRYWPGLPLSECRAKVHAEIVRILDALKVHIGGIELALPGEDATPARWKRAEDALDALVCCWIGTRFLAGAARGYGDETAAIWVPCC